MKLLSHVISVFNHLRSSPIPTNPKALFYFSISSVWGFRFLHILINIVIIRLDYYYLSRCEIHLVVTLICLSLMANDVIGHLYVFCGELFRSFAHFKKNGLSYWVVKNGLSYWVILYILDISYFQIYDVQNLSSILWVAFYFSLIF